MEIFIFSLATVFNFWILAEKIKRTRIIDTIIDFTTMLVLGYLFSGTMAGMAIAMLAGAMISIWLWFNPFVISDEFKRKCVRVCYQGMAMFSIIAIIIIGTFKFIH